MEAGILPGEEILTKMGKYNEANVAHALLRAALEL